MNNTSAPTPFVPSAEQLGTLALASPFASQIYHKNPKLMNEFLTQFGLNRAIEDDEFWHLLCEFTGVANQDDTADEDDVMAGLRQLRARLMLKWIWQDGLGLIELEQLTHELSVFSNCCIRLVYQVSYQGLVARFGVPMTRIDGKRVRDELAVIAMGKLGAMELNLSSDIDLIFIHLGDGETDTSEIGKKSIDNQKFMLHLGRKIIRILDEVTADGFVFRVDMRLRPWGDGSPLVMTLSALNKYFNQHGRTWERFAWLKARVVNTLNPVFADSLHRIAHNFVHRYYIDYSAFGALREMKAMIINQQAQRLDLDNVKLGVGGIRDVEFIVQAFSLIYGGHHVSLAKHPACLDGIRMLSELNYLDKSEAIDLAMAYRFLRRLEHAIQARHDEQTQRLPSNVDELTAIAKVLGFASIDEFRAVLNAHRDKVSVPFNRMVTDRQSPKQENINANQVADELHSLLSDDSMARLDEFMHSRLVAGLDNEPKTRLDTAYPILLHGLLEHAKKDGGVRADTAVAPLVALLEAICRRSIYLVMIAENPDATTNLIPMLSASPWIARELALHPMLLDNFLQQRYLHLPDKTELADILRQSLLRVERFDDENYLAQIRLFKKTQVLAVATADILGLRHIMKVSDSLTFIAEVVLSSALQRAFDELVAKHGYPLCQNGKRASHERTGFAVIGYGKLGGLEMSYASDLDVVFLHQIDEQAQTDGDKAVSGMKFAARLVQKILTYLTAQTRDGRAYEMDMRLRPSGNAGVMVVSTHAFELYQNEKAWAWEHQALVRARGVAGDGDVLAEFDRIRQVVLCKDRDITQVRTDVMDMRQKMQTHLGTKETNTKETNTKHDNQSTDKAAQQFHIKQDFGGLVDIEFLAQYVVLGFAHQYPSLAVWSDNVRIFEEVAKAGLWDKARCDGLTAAYLELRKKTHELALLEQKVIVGDDEWQGTRDFVRRVWEQVLG